MKYLLTVLMFTSFVFSQSSTSKVGNFYYNSDGSSTSKVGNFYYNSDGSSTSKVGDFYYNSDKKKTNTYILDNDNSKTENPKNWWDDPE